MTQRKKAIIIGGGPAGLTAAHEFWKSTDIEPVVLEMSEYWGGISRTVHYKGNHMDIGGHRFFSKSDKVMDWWTSQFPIESDLDEIELAYQNKRTKFTNTASETSTKSAFLVRKRVSRIFYKKTFFDYPISFSVATIRKLGIFNSGLILLSYFKSVLFPIKNEKSLEDFFINRFGKRLYLTFFKSYTEKVWGISCSEISAEWGAQRIKGLSIRKALAHKFFKKQKEKRQGKLSQKETETSLIEYFLYPKYGPGQLWEHVAQTLLDAKLDLRQNIHIEKIERIDNKIVAVLGRNLVTHEIERFEGDYFISTMPIKNLTQSFDSPFSANIQMIADGLKYRSFITIGLLMTELRIKNIQDNWIYIQEPYVQVGRIQVFNNWSPYLVEDPSKTWIGLEYFCDENDLLWNKTDEELKKLAIEELVLLNLLDAKHVEDGVVIKMPKTYPAYFGTYAQFGSLRTELDKIENLFLIGRNGMHKYNNQDHSMLTAMEAVKNIKNGILSKENIWAINTEQTYHEE